MSAMTTGCLAAVVMRRYVAARAASAACAHVPLCLSCLSLPPPCYLFSDSEDDEAASSGDEQDAQDAAHGDGDAAGALCRLRGVVVLLGVAADTPAPPGGRRGISGDMQQPGAGGGMPHSRCSHIERAAAVYAWQAAAQGYWWWWCCCCCARILMLLLLSSLLPQVLDVLVAAATVAVCAALAQV